MPSLTPGGTRPVIIVAVPDHDTRAMVVDAAERRYSADYDVVEVDTASGLQGALQTVAGDGRAVALVLAETADQLVGAAGSPKDVANNPS